MYSSIKNKIFFKIKKRTTHHLQIFAFYLYYNYKRPQFNLKNFVEIFLNPKNRGYGIMAFFCLAMVIVLNCLTMASLVPHLSVFCVMGYIVGFAIGPGPVSWIWTNEFFEQSARAGGATVSCVICWLCTYLVGQFCPVVQLKIGAYVFVFFGVICVGAFVYIKLKLPETKGVVLTHLTMHDND